MLRKKYISLGANPLSVDIFDDKGVLHSFDFRGGLKHLVIKPPFYITTDESEQKLLENYPGFGTSFKLEGSVEKPDVKPEVKAEVKPEPKPEAIEPIEPVVNELKPETTERQFKNVQAAKDWLNDEHKVPFSQLTNKQKVIDEALKVGFILKFETDNK